MSRIPQKQSQILKTTVKSVMKSPLADIIGIKCAQCHLIYPQHLIDQHLITHIQPKYLMPHQINDGAKKLNATILFTDETLSVSSADISSLNISDFPKPQNIRKNIETPSQFAIVSHNLPNLKKDIVSYKGDQRDISSKLDGFELEGNEMFQQMILTQNIQLAKESSHIKSQEIVMYRSSMLKKNGDNFVIKTGKKVNPYQNQPEKSRQYQIVPVSDDTKSKSTEDQHSTGLLTVNIKKHRQPTPRREQINTSAKKQRQTPETALEESRMISQFSPSESKTRFGSHSRIDHIHHPGYYSQRHHNHDYQCEFCHGFYCHHCKSTIPPQYRPVNMGQHLDPKIVDFYKKHVHKGECQVCEKKVK